jgi:drug/metabolite transporter (DMT)-like permease
MLSSKNPLAIVTIKGFGSGFGSLIIALLLNESVTNIRYIIAALILGFVAYGLSIFCYVYAQRELGAAKTSAYYAIAPFIGVAFSFAIFKEIPSATFVVALFIMIIGTYFASTDS